MSRNCKCHACGRGSGAETQSAPVAAIGGDLPCGHSILGLDLITWTCWCGAKAPDLPRGRKRRKPSGAAGGQKTSSSTVQPGDNGRESTTAHTRARPACSVPHKSGRIRTGSVAIREPSVASDYPQSDIAADLAPLSPEQCAARGIRHSSEDDHSTAIFPGDNQHIRRMELCYSTNKAFRRAM